MTKILGYVLLVAGLLLIILPLFQTYQIFTGNAMPPQVFKMPETKIPDKNTNQFDVQQQMQNAMLNILPVELFNNVLNLSSWLMLMFILMLGGKLLAGIGIQLIKIHAGGNNG